MKLYEYNLKVLIKRNEELFPINEIKEIYYLLEKFRKLINILLFEQ